MINDPTFALPFWNWDSPEGMTLPPIFADSSSTLYDSLRNCKHLPPTLIDLNYNGYDVDVPPQRLIDYNLFTMYKQMVSSSKNAKLFFGSPYVAGQTDLEPGQCPWELGSNVLFTEFLFNNFALTFHKKNYKFHIN